MMRATMLAQLGDWTFWEVWDHGFIGPEYDGKPLFGYENVSNPGTPGKPKLGEYHRSLDRAIVAAVGEKYTGPRGAGGTGVGTAADWFCKMIGMDQLAEIGYADNQRALRDALHDTETETTRWKRARLVNEKLEDQGLVLAKRVQS